MSDVLLAHERKMWEDRMKAFDEYYHPTTATRTPYEDAQLWGTLATYDKVLSDLRERIDGVSGSGHEQMTAQRRRCMS